jgi:hypothetical protein
LGDKERDGWVGRKADNGREEGRGGKGTRKRKGKEE